jgi:hypothetical protein
MARLPPGTTWLGSGQEIFIRLPGRVWLQFGVRALPTAVWRAMFLSRSDTVKRQMGGEPDRMKS